MGELPEGDRALRWITILTWIPAFALLVAYGSESEGNFFPWLLLLPMSLSVLFARSQLSGRNGNPRANTVVDAVIVSSSACDTSCYFPLLPLGHLDDFSGPAKDQCRHFSQHGRERLNVIL